MKNLEQEITDYLIQKYNPAAIVIHDSRSIGMEREHSDWDIIMFNKKEVVPEWEIVFDNVNLQLKSILLPFNAEKIWNYRVYLQKNNVRVMYDPDNITPDIIEKATAEYLKPVEYSIIELNEKRVLFKSYLDGMIDYQNEQEAFFRKLGELYLLVIRYWFHILHHISMPQVYLSLPRIEHQDPEYYALLKILASNATNQEKIAAGEEVYERIWK